jgi:hypothetical protein
MNKKLIKNVEARLINLREELAAVRRASLAASRKGDYMQVAKFTARAQKINKEIMDAEIHMASL